MTLGTLAVELAEKMALIAAAALLAVLLPPLRNRLLGVGRPRDRLAAAALGLGLSIWGAMLGFEVLGENLNVRAIGILIAGVLGGPVAGTVAGLGGGLFFASRVEPDTAPWTLIASVSDGVLAGWVAERWPRAFVGARAFVAATLIQLVHLVLLGVGLLAVGSFARYLPAWPAHLAKLLVNAAGVTLFVAVARLVVAREESAVALVRAQAAADAARLEALRRRMEPHFLFNALNALRATIRTDPARARELVADLADLYRYLLSHAEQATVADEIAHARAYLAIERTRLGDEQLQVDTHVEPEVAQARVPSLLLQPLVENAVRHGVAACDGGAIRIAVRRDGENLLVEVIDRGRRPRAALADEGSGIALRTLRERLVRQYGAAASVSLEIDAQGAVARVRLPFERSEGRAREAA
ncbi:MAG: histidine kinase [Myxococcota bacterium]|nr:histidine kinase [Myxococcota bacterium]MDW8361546.1 histidine kinase [Myxococcales bacterium]